MKQKSKCVQIATASTPGEVETTLDVWLGQGWTLVSVFNIGAKVYAVLIRTVVA